MAPSSASAAAPRLLPHQLVARDGRSSYIKRVDTLAGPGAYVIPSSFKTMEMNPQVREIHKVHYGREFARQQRRMSVGTNETVEDTSAEAEADVDGERTLTTQERRDIFLARRERLRELLEKRDERRDHSECSDSLASPTLVTPFKSDALPQSPSLSSTSNYDVFVAGYRQHATSGRRRSGSCARTESVRSPTSPCDLESVGFPTASDDAPRQHRRATKQAASPATSPALAPLAYREYLATTSYSRRLARLHSHERRRSPGSSARPAPSPQ